MNATQEPQQPPTATKNVQIPDDLHLMLKLRAARERMTIRELIEKILRPELSQN